MHADLLPLCELIYTDFLHVALGIKVVELDLSWQLQIGRALIVSLKCDGEHGKPL